jgi:hypothetical protein
VRIHALPQSKIRANRSRFSLIIKSHSNPTSYINHAAPHMELLAAIVDFSTPGWGNQFTKKIQAGDVRIDRLRG